MVAGAAYALIAGAWLDITNRATDDRFGQMCDFQGVVPVAAALRAVAVGIACGVAMRRTEPAMAATLGIHVVVRLLVATQLRPRVATPLTLDAPFDGPTDALSGTGDWIISQHTLTADGMQLGTGGGLDLSRVGDRCPDLRVGPDDPLPGRDAVDRCLDQLGLHQITRYHPASRFWTFQLIESGILVALAAIAVVVAMRLLPRRTT